MPIRRPQKAPSRALQDDELYMLEYPFYGSPKLDGFRCIVVDGHPLTSSMQPFENYFICREFGKYPWLSGLDGEIIVGPPNSPDAFHNTSGPVRRFDGEPDFKYYVFDCYDKYLNYEHRWLRANHQFNWYRVVVLPQVPLYNPTEVKAYEQQMLNEGYEGIMIRSPYAKYKEGRCTFKEMNIFKRKPFVECEAVIVGVEEAMENQNEQEIDKRGLSKRSSCQENLVPKGTLGSFILKATLWESTFKAAPGKGFSAADRQRLWDIRYKLIGHSVVVKYQKYGSRERPRMPSVIKVD